MLTGWSDMIECSFFAYNPASIRELSSYAVIPEEQYVDLPTTLSIDTLRDLAHALGCDPSYTFTLAHETPASNAFIVRAGAEFEDALLNKTVDELNDAGVVWAQAMSQSGISVNSMDTSGFLYELAAHWHNVRSPRDALFGWVEREQPGR